MDPRLLTSTFLGFFIPLFLIFRNKTEGEGRTGLVSVVIALFTLFLELGFVGYVIAIVGALIMLIYVQRLPLLKAFLVFIGSAFLSYVIELGLYKYF